MPIEQWVWVNIYWIVPLIISVISNIYLVWGNYQMGKPQLLPMMRNLSIHIWDFDMQHLTSPESYKGTGQEGKHKIHMAFYIMIHNMGKANAKPIEISLQWKDKYGNLLPEEDLLEYYLREMTFIEGGERRKRWKYFSTPIVPDINYHYIEACIKIIYQDSLNKKYCTTQLFHSSNGRIWYKGEYENFKIGFRQKKPTLKLIGRIDQKQKENNNVVSQAN